MSRYNEGVHSMGSHIVYNCWYIKSSILLCVAGDEYGIFMLAYFGITLLIRHCRFKMLAQHFMNF